MNIDDKLKELNIELPELTPAAGNYVPFVQVGNTLHLSGVLCLQNGTMTHSGLVGQDLSVEEAYQGARVCGLNLLAAIKAATNNFATFKRMVFVSGFVQAPSGFGDSPAVINGVSDLLVEVLGDAGKHSRAAVGVSGLPKNTAVEITAIAEVE